MAPNRLTRTLAALALSQSNVVSAYWREACSVSQMARLDPILAPGTISAHVHKFAGGMNVGASSTGETLQQSSCSTCQVQKDTSAYWTPELYYEHPDGTFESVPNEGMTVYYVGRGGNATSTKPFPAGFSMISGDPVLRHYDTTDLTYENVRPIADRVSFRCINEANDIPETHYINDTNCVNGWRAQLNFQSCWDGVNLYLPKNAHVAYLSGIDYGVCPPSHPVSIPGLFYEILYWTNDVNQQPGGRFVFSYGDPTGFGFHGDFINGWDQDVLEDAVANCLYTDNGGVVTACQALVPSNNVNFPRICPQAPDPIPEQVTGNLASLPGCNPVTTVDTVPQLCGLAGSNSTAIPPTNISATAAATSSPVVTETHPPLLTTASIPLVVTTLTTFVTVTAPVSSIITSSAGSLTTVTVTPDSPITVATSYTYSAINSAAPGVVATQSFGGNPFPQNTSSGTTPSPSVFGTNSFTPGPFRPNTTLTNTVSTIPPSVNTAFTNTFTTVTITATTNAFGANPSTSTFSPGVFVTNSFTTITITGPTNNSPTNTFSETVFQRTDFRDFRLALPGGEDDRKKTIGWTILT